jgi:hypothetical protein
VVRKTGLGTVVVLAFVVASCGSSSKASKVGAVTSGTVASPSSPTMGVGGGTPVPTTVVQPHRLPTGHIAHALQVAEAIRASGVGCATASLERPHATPEVPGGQLLEQVSCEVRDDTVAVTLSPAPTIDLSLAHMGACFVNKSHPGNLSYVKGTNWIAAPEQTTTARLIASRLHLAVETFRC